MEAASNFWARWSWQDDSSCCSSSVLARPERCTFWNIFLNNRCQELKWTRIIWVCFLVHVLIRKLLKRLILLWTSEYINVDSSKYLISQARPPRLDWWERSLLRRVVAERPSTMPSPSAMFTVRISYWCLWVKPEILHSELYDADAVDPKICLELGCKVGGFCRCAECICCYMCTGDCGCIAASHDFDFILQQLLIEKTCFSYKWVFHTISGRFLDLKLSTGALRSSLPRWSRWTMQHRQAPRWVQAAARTRYLNCTSDLYALHIMQSFMLQCKLFCSRESPL